MSEDPAAALPWDPATPGLLTLPSGTVLRGRGLLRPSPTGQAPAGRGLRGLLGMLDEDDAHQTTV